MAHDHGSHDHGSHDHGSHDHGSHDHGSHDHGSGHSGHDHSHPAPRGRALWFVIIMVSVIFVAEVIGGIVSGSLALLADAGHMLSDAAGLIVAAIAMIIGNRQATRKATYGFRRAEVIAAAVNAGAVAVIAVWIVISAFQRLGDPEEIQTGLMAVVAVVGLLANIISAVILNKSAGESLNMKGAYLHVLADLLGSVAVLVAAGVIALTGWQWADAVASIGIAALILPRSWQLLKSAVGVLMENTPANVDVNAVYRDIAAVDEVTEIHDLHVWSIEGEGAVATAHVVVDSPASCGGPVLDRVSAAIGAHGIGHVTVQLEEPDHREHEQLECGDTDPAH